MAIDSANYPFGTRKRWFEGLILASTVMRSFPLSVILLLELCAEVQAWSASSIQRTTTTQLQGLDDATAAIGAESAHVLERKGRCDLISRRALLSSAALTTGAFLASSSVALAEEEQQVLKLPSGLKYIDLNPGTGPSPIYGQLCSIAYKGYIKLPASKEDANPQPQMFGQSNGYLLKHGNGRTISGLDQGLHTMQVGGTRRLIIPAKLGYVTTGLGPLPPSPWDRFRLNALLDDMVRLQGGNLVFEVTLLSVIDDEADQGYYNDGSLSPEDFDTLRTNIQRKAQNAREAAQ